MSAGSFAAEESGKELIWPLAARDGAEHHYVTYTLNTDEKDGKKRQVSSESTTVVKHRVDGNGGFVQTWSWRDSISKYEGYEDSESGLRKMLAEAFGDIELQVSLDKDTYYSKIINSEEIARKMKTMFNKAFDEGIKNVRDEKSNHGPPGIRRNLMPSEKAWLPR